jgi:hypothetical protein
MPASPEEIPAPIVLPELIDGQPAREDSYYSDSDFYTWDDTEFEWVISSEDRPTPATYDATTGVWTVQES